MFVTSFRTQVIQSNYKLIILWNRFKSSILKPLYVVNRRLLHFPRKKDKACAGALWRKLVVRFVLNITFALGVTIIRFN